MDSIGERLREERARIGLSQTTFGELAGVTKKTQMLYEGDERSPDGKYFAAISKAGADVLYIIAGKRSTSSAAIEIPADQQVLLEAYQALTPIKRKQLLAELLTGGKKPSTKNTQSDLPTGNTQVVTGMGNRVAGRDYYRKK